MPSLSSEPLDFMPTTSPFTVQMKQSRLTLTKLS